MLDQRRRTPALRGEIIVSSMLQFHGGLVEAFHATIKYDLLPAFSHSHHDLQHLSLHTQSRTMPRLTTLLRAHAHPVSPPSLPSSSGLPAAVHSPLHSTDKSQDDTDAARIINV